jgi:hypothetical protein
MARDKDGCHRRRFRPRFQARPAISGDSRLWTPLQLRKLSIRREMLEAGSCWFAEEFKATRHSSVRVRNVAPSRLVLPSSFQAGVEDIVREPLDVVPRSFVSSFRKGPSWDEAFSL